MSSGVVTNRVTFMGPLQPAQTEMSMRNTRASSVILGLRKGDRPGC